jgi:hypothetical protein
MPIVHLSVPIKEFEILACIIFNWILRFFC